jgi:hypothetical protein
MTTAAPVTPKKQPGPLDDLRAAEEQVQVAREERRRLGDEATAFFNELARVEAELRGIAETDPEQFGPDGQPKPKSKAAGLRKQLEEGASNRWPQILTGADGRISALEQEVQQGVEDNAVELARREYQGGEKDLADLSALAEQMLPILSRLEERRGHLVDVTSACRGQIDGQDVGADQRLVELRRLLEAHPEFTPPRIPALTPLVGEEEPRKVRAANGEWTHAAWDHEPHPEQPEKVEAAR